ncbi:hypothetical protein ACLOJK_013111, partial [Asimina triloba]
LPKITSPEVMPPLLETPRAPSTVVSSLYATPRAWPATLPPLYLGQRLDRKEQPPLPSQQRGWLTTLMPPPEHTRLDQRTNEWKPRHRIVVGVHKQFHYSLLSLPLLKLHSVQSLRTLSPLAQFEKLEKEALLSLSRAFSPVPLQLSPQLLLCHATSFWHNDRRGDADIGPHDHLGSLDNHDLFRDFPGSNDPSMLLSVHDVTHSEQVLGTITLLGGKGNTLSTHDSSTPPGRRIHQ